MDNETLINYLEWADNSVFTLVRSLDGQLLTKPIAERSGSLHDRVLHLAEEYLAWLYDIQEMDWKEPVDQLGQASTFELLTSIDHLHDEWRNLVQHPPQTQFEIKEREGLVIAISLDEVVFNLVNHASYHRGQIVTLLRSFNLNVPITDYYWFKIAQQSRHPVS